MNTRLCPPLARKVYRRPASIASKPVAAIFVLALLLCHSPSCARAQSDDFNDGNDAGWSHYDPLGAAAALAGQGPKAGYHATNGHYRILAQPFTAIAGLGPARAASFRHDVSYSKFYVSVDLVKWNNALEQAFGFLSRITLIDPMIGGLPTGTNGPGAVNGYTMNYLNVDHALQINRLASEAPTTIGEVSVTLNPTNQYRLVFTGDGPALEGRVYLLSDLSAPLATVNASDGTYFSGVNGLFVYNNQDNNHAADVTYGNFFADTAPPPSLTVQQVFSDEIYVIWPLEPAGYNLQCATNLSPPRVWTDVTNGIVQFPDFNRYQFDLSLEHNFFRLKKSF